MLDSIARVTMAVKAPANPQVDNVKTTDNATPGRNGLEGASGDAEVVPNAVRKSHIKKRRQ